MSQRSKPETCSMAKYRTVLKEYMRKEYMRTYEKKDAIIPDILIHNYSTDVNANGATTMQAIFDVKTVRVDKTIRLTGQGRLYKTTAHAFENPAAEIRSADCRKQYGTSATTLDTKLGTTDNPKPFTTALTSNFHSGGVHPIVFGAFGETKEKTRKLLRSMRIFILKFCLIQLLKKRL